MDSKMFLCVCSRLMQGGKAADYVDDFNKIYNEVYGSDKILAKLKKSDFPDSPGIQQKYDDILNAIENAVVIPELIGKSVYSLCGASTSKIIKSCGKKIFVSGYTKLASLETNVPVIICNTDGKYKVEVINYLNQRIELDKDELPLILEGEKQGIAIDKIIRFYIVHIPMTIKDTVVILGDNTDTNSYVTDVFDFKASKDEIENIIEDMQKSAGSVNYGYLEKCDCIYSAVESFFKKEIDSCKKTSTAITDDIVRIGSEKSDVFKKLRQTETSRCNQLENQFKEISDTICVFRVLVQNLVEKFGVELYKYNASDYKSNLFEIYFNYISCGDWNEAKKWALAISDIDSEAGGIAEEYIELCQDKRKKLSVINFSEHTWYLSKFIIAGIDISSISVKNAELYSNVLGTHITTGKEYFVKALASTDDEKSYLLVKSVSLGYADAVQYINDLYNGSLDADIENKLLAAVVPEICLNYKGKNSNTYIKMAAAMGNTGAISLLADEYFEKNFSKLTQIRKAEKKNDDAEKKRRIGKNLIYMCDYLINEKYMINHYNEIKGEVLFCLRDDYVTAMQCLHLISTDASHFCQAKMYEYGYGVTKDYEMAKSHYSYIKDKEAYNVSDAIKRVQNKYEKSIEVAADDYDANKDYSASYTPSYSSYDDGCFISGTKINMADGSLKNVEDIEPGDRVVVFDHYLGKISEEKIIANGHMDESESKCSVVCLYFDDGKKMDIAIVHGFFDCTENRYVCIDALNVTNYIRHEFLTIVDGILLKSRLLDYKVETRQIKYYAPVSKFHLNVVAEGFLTMVPNEFAINLFGIDQDLKYDMSVLEHVNIVEYDQVKDYVTREEYELYPIAYLNAIIFSKRVDISKFMVAVSQFRSSRNLKAIVAG